MILLIAISMRWRVAQGDIDGAYHRGYELKRLIYFRAPVGGLPATDSMPEVAAGDLLVAQRSVPGLNDAGRQWYYTHRDGIIETGSHLSALAPTLFWRSRDGRTCGVLGTHVDDESAAGVLSDIAREEDLNGHIRRNLMDTRRATSAMMRSKLLAPEQIETARQILRDIDSLDGHTGFLFDKLNFLMDATVGFININQNKIIKIFSVASVAMLPPTLIASLYGMNFRMMPELEWKFGYPFALLLMLLSMVAPFWYFRRKGWLK